MTLTRLAVAVTDDHDVDLVAGCVLAHRTGDVLDAVDLRAVDLDDHVTLLDAGLRGRRARRHVGDDGALVDTELAPTSRR